MYDPKVAYYERLNGVQRVSRRRLQKHRFYDDIGGCSANYRM